MSSSVSNLQLLNNTNHIIYGIDNYTDNYNILFKKDYLFSKVGIYLQDNSDFGGSIDIIEKSHKNFSKLKIFIRKIKSLPLKIITRKYNYIISLLTAHLEWSWVVVKAVSELVLKSIESIFKTW